MIPYGRQDISQSDIDVVVETLHSDWLTQGPAVPRFEREVAGYCGAQHAVAVNSATSALHLACLALGLGRGGKLWTSPNTFVASANCGRYCGASVDFVDIDPWTFNISLDSLTSKLEQAEIDKCLPDVLVVVHFGGLPCDMKEIKALADRYGFRVIEDASHALGASYMAKPVGNCQYSDITIFSFHPVKIITTGEGGMAMTNDAGFARRMMRLRSHGITREKDEMVSESDGPWYYQQVELGFNYRMTDIQAALGWSQMQRLQEFIVRRRYLAQRYHQLLSDMPLVSQAIAPHADSAYHLYVVKTRDASARKRVFDGMRARGIGVNVHYIPVHMQPDYHSMGFNPGDFPVAEDYYTKAISLPMFPALADEQQDKVVSAIKLLLNNLNW